jgi:hypothetical protein
LLDPQAERDRPRLRLLVVEFLEGREHLLALGHFGRARADPAGRPVRSLDGLLPLFGLLLTAQNRVEEDVGDAAHHDEAQEEDRDQL